MLSLVEVRISLKASFVFKSGANPIAKRAIGPNNRPKKNQLPVEYPFCSASQLVNIAFIKNKQL
jgi:hypothetical protein